MKVQDRLAWPFHVRAFRAVVGTITACRLSRWMIRCLCRMGLVPRCISRKLPVDHTFSVPLPNGRSIQYVSGPRDFIGRELYWRGLAGQEAETLTVFYELAQQATMILDVGANTGIFALLGCAANPTCRAIAFEPVPHVYDRLVENIRLNGLSERCLARREAVGDGVGTAVLHVPRDEFPTSASLHPGGHRGTAAYSITVPLITLDEACGTEDKIDLVKIDVEALEDVVLRGMQGILSRWTPTLVVECLPEGPTAEVEAILTRFGYHIYALRKEGPVPSAHVVPDPRRVYRNFLFTVHEDWRELA